MQFCDPYHIAVQGLILYFKQFIAERLPCTVIMKTSERCSTMTPVTPTTRQPNMQNPQASYKTPVSLHNRKRLPQPDKKQPQLVFSSEAYFKELLLFERKRSERFQTSFAVISIDVARLRRTGKTSSLFSSLVQIIHSGIRSTDFAGWLSEGRTLGIVLTEVDTGSVEAVLWKLSGKLRDTLTREQFSVIRFDHCVFPEMIRNGSGKSSKMSAILYSKSERRTTAAKISCCLKRMLDIFGSLFGILLFSPVFLIVPVLIRLTTGEKVFFRQVRVGRFGEHFTLIKFRTMRESSDDTIHRDFIRQYIKGLPSDTGTGQTGIYKIKDDPRITWIGRHLRKTSLDEIPQFFNVLTGKMSLVGPRPAIPYEVDEYDLWHQRRVLEVKPGLTGLWQVKGRSSTDFATMVRMDINYIQRCSPALDLKLLIQTPLSLITTKGAY